jgi:uncharacterized protein YcbK (DUF882 family)
MPTLLRRVSMVAAVIAALALAPVLDAGVAEAKSAPAAKAKGKAKGKAKAKGKSKGKSVKKVASKGKRKKCKGKRCRRGRFSGHGVAKTELRKAPLPKPSGRIVVQSPALRETVEVQIYNEDGSYNQEALAKLDHLFRCRKTSEERAVDPRLYDILSILYDRYEKPINLNSGFRFQRNEGSRHFHASAMDVHIEGVSYREIYKFAETLDMGGMGIGQYPRSDFVHIDFRAPGEPSYRWTDTSGCGGRDPGKLPSRMWKGGGDQS